MHHPSEVPTFISVMLLGPEKSGKSVLAGIAGARSIDEPYRPTVTVEIQSLFFQRESASATNLRVEIYDTPGNKQCHEYALEHLLETQRNFCIVLSPEHFNATTFNAADACGHYLNLVKIAAACCSEDQWINVQFVISKTDLIQDDTEKQRIVDELAIIKSSFFATITSHTRIHIFDNVVFHSSLNINYNNPTQAFNNFLPKLEPKALDDKQPQAKTTSKWNWKKFYNLGKTFLTLGLLSALGLILSTANQDLISSTLITTSLNASLFGLTSLFIGLAAFMFIRAAIKLHEKKNPDLGVKRHLIQNLVKGIGFALLIGLFTAIACDSLEITLLNSMLQPTISAFNQFNFPGLQLAFPFELATVFAITFLAVATYFAIDALCRVYNNLWDHHHPNKVPIASNKALAYLFNVGYNTSGEGYDIIGDENDASTYNFVYNSAGTGSESVYEQQQQQYQKQQQQQQQTQTTTEPLPTRALYS